MVASFDPDGAGFKRAMPALVAGQAVAALEAPGADDFQAVDVREVAGKGREWCGQAHDAQGSLVQHLLAGRLKYLHLLDGAVTVDRHQ